LLLHRKRHSSSFVLSPRPLPSLSNSGSDSPSFLHLSFSCFLKVRKIEFEQAISVGDTESPSARCRRILKDGSCALDASYTGPRPTPPGPHDEDGENGRWTLTETFIKEMIEWFRAGKALPKRLVREIILAAQDVLKQESSLVEVDIEEGLMLDVMGDTHGESMSSSLRFASWKGGLGRERDASNKADFFSFASPLPCLISSGQFYDLLHLFSLTGPPSENHALLFNGESFFTTPRRDAALLVLIPPLPFFAGDFVDRGSWSVEVALTLFAYKVVFPKRIFLNRGSEFTLPFRSFAVNLTDVSLLPSSDHECIQMNRVYGFEGEATHKHGDVTCSFSRLFSSHRSPLQIVHPLARN